MGRFHRKPAGGSVVGLDLTSGRARAVYGPAGDAAPRPLLLDEPHPDLPLAINLEDRAATVGPAGYSLIRAAPHEVCRNYLPMLGQPREWRCGRHRLDAFAAVGLLVQRLRQPFAGQTAIAAALPAYLTVTQVSRIRDAFKTTKLPLGGTISTPLAVAATAADEFATAVVLEADEHALTWTVLAAEAGRARVLTTLVQKSVGIDDWMDRLVDAVSDRCVRMCRRDPRDSGAAEQSVYEQIDAALENLIPGRPVELHVRTTQWFQLLSLPPEDFEQACAKLARQAVDGLSQGLGQAHAAVPAMVPPNVLWLTADAARLPGLVAAVTQHLPEPAAIRPLAADAVAAAAHALADRLTGGHVDSLIPRENRIRMIGAAPVTKAQTAQPR
jgi:hypothetical protein